MAVGTYTAEEQFDTPVRCYFGFIAGAFFFGVGSVAVEYIHVFRANIDVGEEIAPHERMVTLFVVFGQIAIFVHVESHDITERNDTFTVQFYQMFIHAQRRRPCGKTQYERFILCRLELIDARYHIISGPTRNCIIGWFDNQSHDLYIILAFPKSNHFFGSTDVYVKILCIFLKIESDSVIFYLFCVEKV